jgi:predicted N-acetyltransferase YhbS
MTTTWVTRPETADDVSAIREVNLAAFPTAEEADLVEALRASDAWIEGLSIVTEDPEGTVVGHALLTRCHVDGAPALALAPCAVQAASPEEWGRFGGDSRRSGGRPRQGREPRPGLGPR